MIDAKIVIASFVAAGSKAMAVGYGLFADAGTDATANVPAVGWIANATATGALIYLVVYFVTRTLPAHNETIKDIVATNAEATKMAATENKAALADLADNFKEETKNIREERERERGRVSCEFKRPPQ